MSRATPNACVGCRKVAPTEPLQFCGSCRSDLADFKPRDMHAEHEAARLKFYASLRPGVATPTPSKAWRNKTNKSLLDQTPKELASGWDAPCDPTGVENAKAIAKAGLSSGKVCTGTLVHDMYTPCPVHDR